MKNLSKLRKDKDISQETLGSLLGVSQQTVSKYERGLLEGDYETLIKLSDFFNVSIDYLLDNTDVPTPPDIKKSPSLEELKKMSSAEMNTLIIELYYRLPPELQKQAEQYLEFLESTVEKDSK